MKKWFKKTVATILTVAMTMTITTPAFAAQEDTTTDAILTQALAAASAQDKISIDEAISYLNETGILSAGELIAVDLNTSRATTSSIDKYVYVVDFGEFTEEIIFSEISDEVVSYSAAQGETINTVSKYSDGRFLLNGHGITIAKTDSETGNTYSRDTATNTVTLTVASTGENIVTPYAADIDYTPVCPYQTTREYTILASESEQSNVALYEMFCDITLSAFLDFLSFLYPPLSVVSTMWDIGSDIYDFIADTSPETEGLSYLEENYYHKFASPLTGHIDALGYSVTKIVTHWFAEPYYEGDWHTTVIYRTYQHW